MSYRAPNEIVLHPAVETCTGSDYRHDVWLREGWQFTAGRMAGCRSGMFNTVREFRRAEPERVKWNGPYAIIVRRQHAGWLVVGLWRSRKNPAHTARSTCWERDRANAVKAVRVMGLR